MNDFTTIPDIDLPAGQLLINGEWVSAQSGETIAVVNPATGGEIGTIAAANAADVDAAVASSKACFDSKEWRSMRPLDRGRLLEKLALLVEENADHIASLEAIDNGKSVGVARHIDVLFAIDALRYFAGAASKVTGETAHLSPFIDDGGVYRSYTERQPVGVVAGITPWNFPFAQAIQKLAAAIAFGCTIVLKPSEVTSLSALYLGELTRQAGFPAGTVNIVTGNGDPVDTHLVAHDDIRKVTFTGSTKTGQAIHAAVGKTMKRLTLELGGKSPAIILPDANLEQAIPGAAMAIFANSGQICTVGSRLFVHADVYDDVVKGVADFAKTLTLGHAFEPDAAMGPLTSGLQFKKVAAMVEQGLKEGAELVTGGAVHGDTGFFYQPTVMTNVGPNDTLAREEVFGPVLVISKFDTLNEVVAMANDTEFGLAASIWTQNLNAAHMLAARIDAGTVWINTHNILDTAMPFGGMKMSGMGREFGTEAYAAFTEVKAVCMRLDPGDLA